MKNLYISIFLLFTFPTFASAQKNGDTRTVRDTFYYGPTLVAGYQDQQYTQADTLRGNAHWSAVRRYFYLYGKLIVVPLPTTKSSNGVTIQTTDKYKGINTGKGIFDTGWKFNALDTAYWKTELWYSLHDFKPKRFMDFGKVPYYSPTLKPTQYHTGANIGQDFPDY